MALYENENDTLTVENIIHFMFDTSHSYLKSRMKIIIRTCTRYEWLVGQLEFRLKYATIATTTTTIATARIVSN